LRLSALLLALILADGATIRIAAARLPSDRISSPSGGMLPRLAVFLFYSTPGRLEVIPIRPESAVPRTVELALLGNRALQMLVRRNFVCFPAQAPVFGQRSRRDLQWRLAVLYFVRGWSTRSIADRYGLTRERCGQIISDWRIRAITLGFIQDVTPEGTDLARLAEFHAAAPAAVEAPSAPRGDANGRALTRVATKARDAVVNGSAASSVIQAATAVPSVQSATAVASVQAATAVASVQAATAVAANPTMSRTSLAISPGAR
jgi:hypothetical protein